MSPHKKQKQHAAPPQPPPRERPESKQSSQRRKRSRPGEKAMKEIKKFQLSTELLIPKARFSRLVREICMKYTLDVPFLWQSAALMALQESAEAFIVRLFEDSYLCSLHAKRVTLYSKDIKLACWIRRLEGLD
ncbi:histone H3-like centromeric protein A isoform X2 [Dendropsophus ebraccatus]|uniref:histone H3-like centromeric protein A isoform X2 n=1 Tax=Dendropsophus ebraccatus TaxID=150705 RepID=UPI00383166C5